jgi:hypothetical protein
MFCNQSTAAIGISTMMVGGLWASGLLGVAAGSACTSTQQPASARPAGQTDYSTLAEDFVLEVEPVGADPSLRQFTISPADEAEKSELDFEWQFGSSFGFHGVRQAYVFAASGTYAVVVKAHAPDGSVAFVMETSVEIELPNAENLPPLASARVTAAAGAEKRMLLDGRDSSDPEGAVLEYQWEQTAGQPRVALTNAEDSVASFDVPAVTVQTVLEFTLTVGDSVNESEARVSVTLEPETPVSGPVDADDPDEGLDDITTGGEPDDGDTSGFPVVGGGGGPAETEDPVETGTMVDDTPTNWNAVTPPPCAVVAKNVADIQSYAWDTFNRPLAILFDRPLTFTQGIYFPEGPYGTNVFGVGTRPTITFAMTFNGNYADPSNNANGFSLGGRIGAVRNLDFTGFNTAGVALKGSGMELMSVANCSFHDIGNQWFTHRVIPAATQSDAVGTTTIGAFNLANGHIDIRNCSFQRCSTNMERWARVLYISARSVSVLDSVYQQTGNAFGVGFYVNGSANHLCGNTVSSPALSQSSDGQPVPSKMFLTGAQDLSIFTQNTCSGLLENPFGSAPTPAKHYNGDNNVSGITLNTPNQFAYYSGVGYYSFADWQNLGFERPVDQLLPPSATLVRTEAELRAAAARTANEDLVILIGSPLSVSDTVTFPAGGRIVRLVGVGNQPTVTFNMTFDGNWSAPATQRQRPGLAFASKRVFIRNLAFAGYQLGGAVLRSDATESFEVSKCQFRDIGTLSVAPRIAAPAVITDTISTRCIETGTSNLLVHVNNSSFLRCATNQAKWGACLDLAGRNVMVADNVIEDSGNFLFCRSSVANAIFEVLGNFVTRPAECAQPDGTRGRPWLVTLPAGQQFTFAYNQVAGVFRKPWQGLPDVSKQLAVENNYYGASYQDAWATDAAGTGTLTWAQWRALGLD